MHKGSQVQSIKIKALGLGSPTLNSWEPGFPGPSRGKLPKQVSVETKTVKAGPEGAWDTCPVGPHDPGKEEGRFPGL